MDAPPGQDTFFKRKCGPMPPYIHKEIEKDIKTISGYLTYLEEGRLTYRSREVLYVVGVGIVDHSCCGAGGCGFIEVSGYVVSWHLGTDDAGRWMSDVDPIRNEEEKREISSLLERRHPHVQINFN